MPQPVQDGSMNISIMGALYLVVPNNFQRRQMLAHSVKPPRPFTADGVVAKIQVSKRWALPQRRRKPPRPFIADVVDAKIQVSK